MSEIRANKLVNEAGTGSVELTEGASIPTGKTISGAGTIALNSSGTAGGLSGTPNIVVGLVTATSGSFSGNIDITGNLSVGGTVTKEDVTNVDSVGVITARAGIDVPAGTVYLSGISKEKAKVTTTAIDSNSTFDLNDGMVHFRNSGTPGAHSSNALLTYSPSNVNTFMADNDVVTVTIMNTGASNAYFGGLSIDGSSQTVNWSGGSAPSDGSAKDTYVFTIVKTAASTYTVFGNQTKTA